MSSEKVENKTLKSREIIQKIEYLNVASDIRNELDLKELKQ